MKRIVFAIVLCLLVGPAMLAQEMLSLEGSWDFATGDSVRYADYVMLPGSMQSNGKDGSYRGKAWYKKTVYVPQSWQGSHISLFLERPHQQTTVIVNGIKVGRQQWLYTPHHYDVSPCIRPGIRNTIEVCVENVSGWNGIVGRLELRAQPAEMFLRHVRFQPVPFSGMVQLDVSLGGHVNAFSSGVVGVLVQRADNDSADVVERYFEVGSTHNRLDMPVGSRVALWDEFHPHLYRMGIVMGDDYHETTFGMRQLSREGGVPMLNGCPLFLRGIEDTGRYPETGFPPTDEDYWARRFKKLKAWGLNYVLFRGHCPPEAAFFAADRLGLYLQPDVQPADMQRIADDFSCHPSLMAHLDSCLQTIPPGADYKEAIERNLCDTTSRGFIMQGFDEAASRPEDWTQYCAPVVPLAIFPQRRYTSADTLRVPIEIRNAMDGDVNPVRISYYVKDDSLQVLGGGVLAVKALPVGLSKDIGTVVFPLDKVSRPGKLSLHVLIANRVENHWDIWVEPQSQND